MFPFIAVNPQKRAQHQDVLVGCQFKLSLVKKLMVVAVAPDTEESWENLESLLAELDREDRDQFVTEVFHRTVERD